MSRRVSPGQLTRAKVSPIRDSVLALGEVFDLLPDGVVAIDRGGRIAFANLAMPRILGYAQAELVGQPLGMLIPERHRAKHAHLVEHFCAQARSTPMGERPVLLALHKSGEEVPVSISIASFELSADRYGVAIIRDASPVRDQLGKAMARAETDALTGLGNRLCLARRMQRQLESAQPFGLLFLDLTEFKPFNDRYGHAMGDEVLRLVAKRLQALVRKNDLAVRQGGDEFVVLLDRLSDADDLQARAAGVAFRLSQPFHIRGTAARVGVNIGGALYPRDGECETDLLAVADRNMYRAKQAARAYCTDSAVE
ncbi:MAG: sensor domain-containing diguanylate cyclase [Gammaproteobacteria bacterium]|nr:sensor domain-containing diguanylate cyclase [Gammaproteobacteria bacterium]